ncbi:MAG TPA: cupin domain-containing protein [Steroidobacteraceae bacterium]
MAATRQVLASGNDLEVTRLDYGAGDGAALHSHDHEQVGWVSSGRFRLNVAGKVTVHGADSAYVVPAHLTHTFEVLEPGVVYIVTSPRQKTKTLGLT